MPLVGNVAERACGLLCYTPIVVEFTWRSSEIHTVRRTGFPLTHAHYLTSTASQGQTIRTGLTIDCARTAPQGVRGTKDAEWWLHLYVMFSRATCLADMLLLRPPPRALLERGPPHSVMRALATFEQKIRATAQDAYGLAAKFACTLPDHD